MISTLSRQQRRAADRKLRKTLGRRGFPPGLQSSWPRRPAEMMQGHDMPSGTPDAAALLWATSLMTVFGDNDGVGALPTTPREPLAARVVGHCRSISAEQPVFLPFTRHDARHRAGACHLNVAHLVRERGGQAVTGWMIWESATLVDAEHHCCWRAPDGVLFDVTPRVDGEDRVLFLPDPARRIAAGDGRTVRMWANRTNMATMPFTIRGGLPSRGERADVMWDSRTLELASALGLGRTVEEVVSAVLASYGCHPPQPSGAGAPEAADSD